MGDDEEYERKREERRKQREEERRKREEEEELEAKKREEARAARRNQRESGVTISTTSSPTKSTVSPTSSAPSTPTNSATTTTSPSRVERTSSRGEKSSILESNKLFVQEIQTKSRASSASQSDGPRPLKEREVIGLFMSAGILDHVAKAIVKTHPDLLSLNEKNGEDFKSILRETINVLDKEGVPPTIWEIENNKNVEQAAILASDGSAQQTVKKRVALCKICKDSAVIHPAYPEKMRQYFKVLQDFKGTLKKEDWLCRSCYADFYRDNRDWINDNTEDIAAESQEEENEEEALKAELRKSKEAFIKLVAPLLLIVAKNISPEAIGHRKMLMRYIAKAQINISQLPVALYLLRKLGSGIVDQEDFEKEVGIGKYSDLFCYSSWNSKPAQREILRLNEAERMKKKEENATRKAKEEAERRQKESDEQKEIERLKDREAQLEKAQKEAEIAARNAKWNKIAEARKKEDLEDSENRKKLEANREKQRDKKEAERKASKKARENELKQMEMAMKAKEEELKLKKEERYRRQRLESQQRAAEVRNTTKLMNI